MKMIAEITKTFTLPPPPSSLDRENPTRERTALLVQPDPPSTATSVTRHSAPHSSPSPTPSSLPASKAYPAYPDSHRHHRQTYRRCSALLSRHDIVRVENVPLPTRRQRWRAVRDLTGAVESFLLPPRDADCELAGCDLYTVGEFALPAPANLRVDSGQNPLAVDSGVNPPNPLNAPRPEWKGVAEINPRHMRYARRQTERGRVAAPEAYDEVREIECGARPSDSVRLRCCGELNWSSDRWREGVGRLDEAREMWAAEAAAPACRSAE